jgi:hypothetical protein
VVTVDDGRVKEVVEDSGAAKVDETTPPVQAPPNKTATKTIKSLCTRTPYALTQQLDKPI